MTTTNNGVLMFGSTGEECLQLVKRSGEAGMTANEICAVTGVSSSRITAALHHLHEHHCVRREMRPVPGSRSQYRYWYVREYAAQPTHRSARAVYNVLSEIFGEK